MTSAKISAFRLLSWGARHNIRIAGSVSAEIQQLADSTIEESGR